jgi:hypothetical protein
MVIAQQGAVKVGHNVGAGGLTTMAVIMLLSLSISEHPIVREKAIRMPVMNKTQGAERMNVRMELLAQEDGRELLLCRSAALNGKSLPESIRSFPCKSSMGEVGTQQTRWLWQAVVERSRNILW